MSLDGYIARSDGSLDWLDAVQVEGEDYGYHSFYESVDCLILGRKTYETALGFDEWPYTGKHVVVVTSQALESNHGERFFSGSPMQLVEELTAEGRTHAYVDGGAIIQQFLASDRLDDLTISVVPVVLGAGIRLFGGAFPERQLRLVDCRSWSSGLVQLRYQVSRN